jgi:putative transposase
MTVGRKPYPSDLADAEWALVEPFIPKTGGRPSTVDRRDAVSAIACNLRTGCAWRQLPHDFPVWTAVYDLFRRWRIDGTWKRIHDNPREEMRRRDGREPAPSAAIADSQSVKTAEKGGMATTPPRR